METVNVVEINEGLIIRLRRFETAEMAELLFTQLLIEEGVTSERIEEFYLCEGHYSSCGGTYSIQLVHSI